jgi:hypothetical protein
MKTFKVTYKTIKSNTRKTMYAESANDIIAMNICSANFLGAIPLYAEIETDISIERYDDRVEIKSIGNIELGDFINACDDADFSLNSNVTGHLMLIDDRCELTYMLNDYGVDVIDTLNEKGAFTAPLSILEYSDFK